jgi:putative hemolysin
MKLLAGRMVIAASFAAALLLLSGTAARAQSSNEKIKSDNQASAYCVQTGGVVEVRKPAYGTNGSDPLLLSGTKQFCRYTASDKSSIWVLLSTLTTPKPTLAALAYYAQEPYQGGNGSPGSLYCTQLGGTDLFGGINAAGSSRTTRRTCWTRAFSQMSPQLILTDFSTIPITLSAVLIFPLC